MHFQLLISVRDEQEALAALRGGADWIDLKEPRRGALGSVDAAAAGRIVAAVGGQVPVSAAAGELVDWAEGAGRELLEVEGISQIKVGLACCAVVAGWQTLWRHAQREARNYGRKLIPAVYADHQRAGAPSFQRILESTELGEGDYLLIDTYDKQGPGLVELVAGDELTKMLSAARRAGVRIAVAGRLTAANVSILPSTLVDLVAFRGAACDEGRCQRVSQSRVEFLRQSVTTAHGRSRDRLHREARRRYPA